MAREVEEENCDLEPSSLSVGLRERGCLHTVSLCVGSPEARPKLLLTRKDGWRPFYGMGGYGSKDKLFCWKRARMNRARQRAPQGEGRLVWGNQGRVGMEEEGVLGRAARRLPVVFRPPQPPAIQPRVVHEEEFCEECRQEATREAREEAGYDVLRGHFRPLPPLV